MPKGRPQASDSWLRFYREEKGWTQSKLATEAGVSHVSINHFEKDRTPSPRTAQRIAEALGIDERWIFPANGMKTPREAARWYAELVASQPTVVSEEEWEHDVSKLDSSAHLHARQSYYRRQDPKTYKPFSLVLADGRVLTDEMPEWFAEQIEDSR